jgi:hypothetical protein
MQCFRAHLRFGGRPEPLHGPIFITLTSGVTGRSSRWGPSPGSFTPPRFSAFQLLDPEGRRSHFYRPSRRRAHALGRRARRSPPRSKHSNSTTSGQGSPANGDRGTRPAARLLPPAGRAAAGVCHEGQERRGTPRASLVCTLSAQASARLAGKVAVAHGPERQRGSKLLQFHDSALARRRRVVGG